MIIEDKELRERILLNLKCYAYYNKRGVRTVAIDCGVDRGWLTKTKSGRAMHTETLEKFCEYLNITMDELTAEELPEDVAKYIDAKYPPIPMARTTNGGRKPKYDRPRKPTLIREGNHLPWYRSENAMPLDASICKKCKYRDAAMTEGKGLCNYFAIKEELKPLGSITDHKHCSCFEKGKMIKAKPKSVQLPQGIVYE